MAELTRAMLEEAMRRLRDAPPAPYNPKLILHPEKARIAVEMGYIDQDGYLNWDRIAEDILRHTDGEAKP